MSGIRIAPLSCDFDRWGDLLALIVQSFAYMDDDPPSSAKLLTVESLREKASREKTFLALSDDEIVGCIFADERADHLYVGKLAVAAEWQGRGIGRQLLRKAEEFACEKGKNALTLQTRIELAANQEAFYRLGFREIERTAHIGFDRLTSITMRKNLA